jgi:GNAT superfamily N-acetyltransferase
VEVRRITADDWQLLRTLRLASLRDAPEAFGQTYNNAALEPDAEWQSAARASAKGDRRAWFLFFDDAGLAQGLVQARRRPAADCLVFSMWVAPGARRGGSGRALLGAVESWARGWGAQRIVLWVFGANEGAQRFYERTGFRFVPEGPDAESGRSYGAVAMERVLG